MQNFSSRLLALLKPNIVNEQCDELYRRMYVVNIFSLVGLLLTTIIAITATVNGNNMLALLLWLSSTIYIFSYIIQRFTHNTALSSGIILYSVAFVLLCIVYSGGINNTGPLWVYIIAPVAFFLHGLKRGGIELTVFIIVLSIMMFTPNQLLIEAF